MIMDRHFSCFELDVVGIVIEISYHSVQVLRGGGRSIFETRLTFS